MFLFSPVSALIYIYFNFSGHLVYGQFSKCSKGIIVYSYTYLLSNGLLTVKRTHDKIGRISLLPPPVRKIEIQLAWLGPHAHPRTRITEGKDTKTAPIWVT